MATLTSRISSVRCLSGSAQLKAMPAFSRVSVHCRRPLACRAQAEDSPSEDDKSAYPQAAAPSSPGLYTGYITKDSAGIAVIDVVEPAVYVEGTGSRLERESTSTPAVIGALLALGGAGAALAFLGVNSTQLEASLSLSQYADKFSTEVSSTASLVQPAAVVAEIAPFNAEAPALAVVT